MVFDVPSLDDHQEAYLLWMGSKRYWRRGQLGHCRHSVSTGAGESRAIHRRMGVSLVPSMVGLCVKFWHPSMTYSGQFTCAAPAESAPPQLETCHP